MSSAPRFALALFCGVFTWFLCFTFEATPALMAGLTAAGGLAGFLLGGVRPAPGGESARYQGGAGEGSGHAGDSGGGEGG